MSKTFKYVFSLRHTFKKVMLDQKKKKKNLLSCRSKKLIVVQTHVFLNAGLA